MIITNIERQSITLGLYELRRDHFDPSPNGISALLNDPTRKDDQIEHPYGRIEEDELFGEDAVLTIYYNDNE